ncbi:MAG: preprotein translocase subunit SecE [Planctomycetales bacterium]|nr:preprotein translocase subunit SecE [Planctomycetales bacterium]
MAELISGMLSTSRYKREQGKVARQVTFAAILALVAIGAWRWSSQTGLTATGRFVWPMVLLAVGAFLAFRVVNIPRFAEFLISVESEMNKVSWPSRDELKRASLVVIIVIFLLVAILFAYDVFLKWLVGLFL